MSDTDSQIIRAANPQLDSPGMLEIYAESIRNNIATFEEVNPTVLEFAQRVSKVLETHPWIVMESNGSILGYAYGSQHRPRGGYRWTAEVSVYVHPDVQGQGIGRRLYSFLIDLLKRMGYKNLLAIISTPNPASEALHKRFGFQKIGEFNSIGYKFGKWQTTCWWQAQIGQLEKEPDFPILFPIYCNQIGW